MIELFIEVLCVIYNIVIFCESLVMRWNIGDSLYSSRVYSRYFIDVKVEGVIFDDTGKCRG